MRLPRWPFVLLLVISVIAPLAAVSWWLISPQLTMRKFIALMAAGKYAEANKMMRNGRWSVDGRYVAFESGDVKATFPADYFPRAFSQNIEHYTPVAQDWISGERRFGANEKTFLVTFKFSAGPQRVTFNELYLYQEDKRIYKELSLYGFTANVAATSPLTLEGSYTFGDPDGGYFVLFIDDSEKCRVPVCLGNSNYRLTCTESLVGQAKYRIEVIDKDGNVRNKLERNFDH